MTQKIEPERFQVDKDAKIELAKWPTRVKPYFDSKSDYKAFLDDHIDKLSDLQGRLYAENRHALLLIFQAMDAAGKDSAIKHVMSGVNPQGCQVYSFKHPSAEELEHDFLWRTTRCLPERGRIGIFNRSYYEEVLIVRVHRDILQSQNLPDDVEAQTIWEDRYRSIIDLESHLHRNGTQIIKFFLHVSKEEQRTRFLKRIDDPEKNWKFSESDLAERKLWNRYMEAYEACLPATSRKTSPWYIVPADDKANARLIISQIIVNKLSEMKLKYPETGPQRRRELHKIRKQLARG